MKDKDKKKTKFRKIKFGSRKFLRANSLSAISVSFENYADEDWGSRPDVYFVMNSGQGQEICLYELKDIKKLSAMLSAFVTQVEAVK